jgi:S1-C subfamily serine protease
MLLVATLLVSIAAVPAEGDYGRWAAEDPEQWPRIAMVNAIRYTDSNHPRAGSAFLLDTGDEIVAVTAKHVLRYFKSEAMDSVSFRGTLVRWEMFPKDDPSDVTLARALINEDDDESLEGIRAERDWVLLNVERVSETVTPLRLRTTPLEPGETVFVVGWRYTDEGPQHVRRGQVVRSEQGSVLIDVPELADNKMPGLSGTPVIDSRGYVIGLMSSKSGKRESLAGVDYPQQVLREPRREVEPDASAACAQRMSEHFSRRGWVGITPEVGADDVISVVEVFSGSPADEAGVRRGDLLRGINGIRHAGDPAAFRAAYDSFRPGVTVVFDLERNGESLSVEVHLKPIPESMLEQWIREECP